MGKQWQTSFSWAPKSLWMVDCSHKIESHLLLGRKAITNLDSTLKSRDITCPTKLCIVKAMVFPVVIYGHESWTIRKAKCRRLDAFELWCWRRLLRVLLDCKEIKPVHHKGNQPWIFIGRTDAILATCCEELTHCKSPDAGKDWRQEKWMTEDEMVGWHHRLDGHEFE